MSIAYAPIEHALRHDDSALKEAAVLAAMHRELEARFAGTSVSPKDIGDKVLQATSELAKQRRYHEVENRDKLFTVLSAEEKDMYGQLNGEEEHVGPFLTLFGQAATKILADRISRRGIRKITVQLGGKRQYGKWESTHGLDEFARTIPDQVLKVAPVATKVKTLGDRQGDHWMDLKDEDDYYGYTYRPLVDEAVWKPGDPIMHSLLRRRRPGADISIPGLLPVEVFKESQAVLITSQTDGHTQSLIQEESERLASQDAEFTTQNPELAAATGYAFERAIKALKGRTKDVVPVSADYFAVTRNPILFPYVELYQPE